MFFLVQACIFFPNRLSYLLKSVLSQLVNKVNPFVQHFRKIFTWQQSYKVIVRYCHWHFSYSVSVQSVPKVVGTLWEQKFILLLLLIKNIYKYPGLIRKQVFFTKKSLSGIKYSVKNLHKLGVSKHASNFLRSIRLDHEIATSLFEVLQKT